MDRLTGDLGVDVIDELGCVSGSMLHADALRRTYGRSLRHRLDNALYMKPQETWGRMPVKILCGDFYQLPPVPASASLLASMRGQSYEHQQGRKLLSDIKYVVDFVQMQRFTDPLLIEVLEAMRTPGGKKISEESWQAIVETQIQRPGSASQPAGRGSRSAAPVPWDTRLREARGWYESAYEWRLVSYAMHAQAILNAHDAGAILFYIPAVDKPSVHLGQDQFDEMRAHPNVSSTGHLMGLLPWHVGMEMVLTASLLPPKYVRGTACKAVGIELHPQEPCIKGRESIATQGCVVLHYMPKCIYVQIEGSTQVFLQPSSPGAFQPGATDLRGVLAITPATQSWHFTPSSSTGYIQVVRTQMLLPRKQCTLHGVQGKTADPGFIAHWAFPLKISKEAKWLAYYVILSRPRSFSTLLSHGLPSREIIEGGPPEEIANTLKELFSEKIKATKAACQAARQQMGWPPRSG